MPLRGASAKPPARQPDRMPATAGVFGHEGEDVEALRRQEAAIGREGAGLPLAPAPC